MKVEGKEVNLNGPLLLILLPRSPLPLTRHPSNRDLEEKLGIFLHRSRLMFVERFEPCIPMYREK